MDGTARRARQLESVPGRSWAALALAALAYTVVSLTLTATNIAFPAIEDTFADSSRATLSWSLSGYSIALATFMVPAGRLSDRTGRRRVFFAGVWIYLIASLACALAPTAPIFVAGRIVQGLGGSLTIPTSLALVLPDFPPARRASAVAVWTASGTIGAAIAPTLAAAIVSSIGWRWVYVIALPIAVALLTVGRTLLKESDPQGGDERLDYIGFPMGTVAIGLIAFIIVQVPRWGWTHPSVVGCAVGVAVLLPLFVYRSLRHPAPLLDLRIFRKPQLWSVSIANLVLSMLGASTWLVWPLFLIEIWDFSLVRAGLGITPGPVCASAFGLLSGWLADRYGRLPLIRYGPLCNLAAMLIMAQAIGEEPSYWTTFFPAVALFGTGFGLAFSSLNAAALDGQPEEMFGEVNGGFNTIRNLAGGLGVAATIAILGDTDQIGFDRFDRFFFVFALFAAIPALAINLFYPRGRPPQAREQAATYQQ